MITSAQASLLLDLAGLLKKHGPDVFHSLATVLRDPALVSETCELLEKFAQVSGSSNSKTLKKGSKNSLRERIAAIAESSPERANLLRQLLEQLTRTESISPADLRAYARQVGLPDLPKGDRRRAIRAFVSHLFDFDQETIQRHLQNLAALPNHNRRDLSEWTRLILNPELRTKQDA
jgi:hypothetical protein